MNAILSWYRRRSDELNASKIDLKTEKEGLAGIRQTGSRQSHWDRDNVLEALRGERSCLSLRWLLSRILLGENWNNHSTLPVTAVNFELLVLWVFDDTAPSWWLVW